MKKEISWKETLQVCGIFAAWFVLGWLGHMAWHKYHKPNAIHVSRTAWDEIHFSPKCMGQQKDVAVNRQYLYANCPGGPVTVQNYIFK